MIEVGFAAARAAGRRAALDFELQNAHLYPHLQHFAPLAGPHQARADFAWLIRPTPQDLIDVLSPCHDPFAVRTHRASTPAAPNYISLLSLGLLSGGEPAGTRAFSMPRRRKHWRGPRNGPPRTDARGTRPRAKNRRAGEKKSAEPHDALGESSVGGTRRRQTTVVVLRPRRGLAARRDRNFGSSICPKSAGSYASTDRRGWGNRSRATPIARLRLPLRLRPTRAAYCHLGGRALCLLIGGQVRGRLILASGSGHSSAGRG